MNTSHKIALGVIAALGITAGTTALAHDHDGKMGHGPGGHGAKGQCHDGGHEARLDALKSELKLSHAQEPAWQAFEAAVKAQQDAHGTGHDMAQGAQGTDPMSSRIEHMEKQLAGMKEIQAARSALYQVLTMEQKAVLDQHGPRGHHG